MISHRLASCKLCDEIVVLKRGRIIEVGEHNELLKRGGEYSRLWNSQVELYTNTTR